MNRSINKTIFLSALLGILAGCVQAKTAPADKQISSNSVQETSVLSNTTDRQTAVLLETMPSKLPVPKVALPSPDKQIDQLKAWDKNLRFLKTSFTQVSLYDGVEISRSSGQLFYDKSKSLLRLDTQDADGALIQSAVTNKKEIHILDDKNHIIMSMPWDEWQQNQPNQALFDFGNYTALLNRHNIKAVRPNYFKLTPKTGEEYTLYITLSAQDAFPTSFQLESNGMTTQANLQNVQKNQPLLANTFGGIFK